MKKILLFAAAAMVAASASAAEKVLADNDFSKMEAYAMWHGGSGEFSIKDGGLTIENAAATDNFWDVQYMVVDGVSVTAGTEYTVNVKIKGFSGTLHYVMGAWGTDVFAGAAEVEKKDDWQTVTFKGSATADVEGVHLLLQTGEFVGAYTIESVKVTYDDGEAGGGDEPGGDTPAEPAQTVLSETDFTTASAYNFWKSDATNAEVKDGALVITNEAATDNFWDIQYMVADHFALVGGTEYTVDVKIKGFKGNLHYNMGTWSSNVNGEVKVEESADWQNVVFKVVAKEDTDDTAHLLLQSGDFVGAYSIASCKITYETKGDGVEAVAVPLKVNTGVYNLQGVKVADSLDEVTVPGLYISNGKKYIKK